jgi:aerobic carbon-monoxide dehydrogenase small subunit
MSTHQIRLMLNGEQLEATVPGNRLLADFLRDDLCLTGTKRGCETGVCGACSVHLDGVVTKSCLCLAFQVDGLAVTTIEGLAPDTTLHVLQEAFMIHGGLQCGYCTPGFLMAAADLLARDADPSEDTIRKALSGNLCRCTGYQGIVDAVRAAARKLHGA